MAMSPWIVTPRRWAPPARPRGVAARAQVAAHTGIVPNHVILDPDASYQVTALVALTHSRQELERRARALGLTLANVVDPAPYVLAVPPGYRYMTATVKTPEKRAVNTPPIELPKKMGAAYALFDQTRILSMTPQPSAVLGSERQDVITFSGAPPPWLTGGVFSTGAAPTDSDIANLSAFASKYSQNLTQSVGYAPGFSGLRNSVLLSFMDWSTPFEGYLGYMYTDALGLVTTGMGNLIDCNGCTSPPASALSLPWKHADGSAASQDEIVAAWQTVKGAFPGVTSTACASLTDLRLSHDDVEALVQKQMQANDAFIASHLTGYSDAPADAQLAVHSMAWAMGPGFASSWTQFRNAFAQGDFAGAAEQSHMQGVGIDMRNLADKLLLYNAANVVSAGADPDQLYYLDQDFTSAPSNGGPGLLGSLVLMGGIAALTVGGYSYVQGRRKAGLPLLPELPALQLPWKRAA